MAYAIPAELAHWLGLEPLSAPDTERAQLLIDLAAAVIEDEAEQKLEQSPETAVLDGPGTRELVLPRWPVTAVMSVKVRGVDGVEETLVEGADADYTWSESGVLTATGHWPSHDRAVTVVYAPGFAAIPNGLKRIALRLAGAGWDNPTGVASERLGSWETKYVASSSDAAAAGMELNSAEKRTISAYRART